MVVTEMVMVEVVMMVVIDGSGDMVVVVMITSPCSVVYYTSGLPNFNTTGVWPHPKWSYYSLKVTLLSLNYGYKILQSIAPEHWLMVPLLWNNGIYK